MDNAQPATSLRGFLPLIVVGIVVAMLRFGREILIPVALAGFLCLVLSPAANFLERRLKTGRIASVLIVLFLFFSAISGLTWMIGAQTAGLVSGIPKYHTTLVAKVQSFTESVQSVFGKATAAMERIKKEAAPKKHERSVAEGADGPPLLATEGGEPGGMELNAGIIEAEVMKEEEPVKVEVVSSDFDMVSVLGTFLWPAVNPLITITASAMLLLFFLLNRHELRDRLVRLSGRAQVPLTTAALDDCAIRVRRFLLAQMYANGLLGFMIGAGLYALGLPNAALWGFIAAVARFLPYVGTFIAAVLPFTLAVAHFEGWTIPLLVISWCLVVDIISANVFEPWFYGTRTGLSPLAILLAFMFWTWLWGGFGLFLATPITVCLVVFGKHVPTYEGVYLLLSDEAVLEPSTVFYQRLLTRDTAVAIQVAKDHEKLHGRLSMLDDMVLPGLAQIVADRNAEMIDGERMTTIRRCVGEIVQTEPGDQPEDGQVRVLVVGIDAENDAVIRDSLQDAAAASELSIHVQLVQGLSSEIVAEVQAQDPNYVVLGTLEPRSIDRLRYTYKRLRQECRNLRIRVLGYPGTKYGSRLIRRLSIEVSGQEAHSLKALVDEWNRQQPATPAEEESPISPHAALAVGAV